MHPFSHTQYIDNHTNIKRINQSRVEAFTGVAVCSNLRHFHTFGCPAYVLSNGQQKSIGKWEPRAHVGIYLGPSPRHATPHPNPNDRIGITTVPCQV
jgi:hypothetical protein